jgi:predicted transcriptional regulator
MGYEMKRKKRTFAKCMHKKPNVVSEYLTGRKRIGHGLFRFQRRLLQQLSADKEMKQVGVDKIQYYGSVASAPPQDHIVMRHHAKRPAKTVVATAEWR